ncbi:HD domain-containing protein [Deltaproteobacteria bacterium TL4]
MLIEKSIPLLEEILGPWEKEIGKDYQGYKNHVYRVVHFCLALHPGNQEGREKVIIAGCFHDLGIWTSHTLNYLEPSIELVKNYLKTENKNSLLDEIELMIYYHHKITPFEDGNYPLVESFRKADLVDVSLGMMRSGLSKEQVQLVKNNFPNSGFHHTLLRLISSEFKRNPLKPLPVMKW